MRVLLERLTLVWMSFIVLSLVSTGISDAEIDPGAIEGLWLLNEGEGEVAKDSSGNGKDGTISGAEWVDGKFGRALEFDGTGRDKLIINNYFGIGGADTRTIVFWWKSSATSRHSWLKWGINSATEKYSIRGDIDQIPGKVILRVDVNGGSRFGTIDVCDGEWHHIAVVLPVDSNSVGDHLFYVDGVLDGDAQGGGGGINTNNETTEVHIGAEIPGIWHDDFANGIMDEIAIISAALNEADIKTIMTQGFLKALAVEYTGKLTTTWAAVKTHVER
jgi:hypothetical protein